ncbi:MAG: SdpI family protein [Halobacteriaceae archaeon]
MELETRHRFGLAVALVLVGAVASALAAPDLPERVATHWNAAGEPDDYAAKWVALVGMPALATGLLAMLAVVPRIDPLGENIADFRSTYDWFAVALTAFLTALHLGVLAYNLGYEFDFLRLVAVGVAALYYFVGRVIDRAKRNWFVGVRTPWTLSNDEVWDRTHALAARLFRVAAVVALLGAAVGEFVVYFLAVPAAAIAVVATGYSYYAYRQVESEDALGG